MTPAAGLSSLHTCIHKSTHTCACGHMHIHVNMYTHTALGARSCDEVSALPIQLVGMAMVLSFWKAVSPFVARTVWLLFGNATLTSAMQRTVGGGEGRQGNHYTWGLERPWGAQAVAQLRSGRSLEGIAGPSVYFSLSFPSHEITVLLCNLFLHSVLKKKKKRERWGPPPSALAFLSPQP